MAGRNPTNVEKPTIPSVDEILGVNNIAKLKAQIVHNLARQLVIDATVQTAAGDPDSAVAVGYGPNEKGSYIGEDGQKYFTWAEQRKDIERGIKTTVQAVDKAGQRANFDQALKELQ